MTTPTTSRRFAAFPHLRPLAAAAAALTIGGVLAAVPGVASAATTTGFTPTPQRLLDTRTGVGKPAGPVSGVVPLTIPNSVPTGDTAVLTVTPTQATGPGYVAVYPAGSAAPATSNVNFGVATTQTDEVLVTPGTNGRVDLKVGGGPVQLVVDLEGYLPTAAYTPVTSTRLADSRTGLGFPRHQVSGLVNLTVPASVPATAREVALTVTATNSAGSGYVTAYPAGQARPATSNVNFDRGITQANLVLLPIGANRQVSFFVGGSADLIVDFDGYTPAGSAVTPLTATRIADSRIPRGLPRGPIRGAVTVTLPASVPAGTSAVLLNVAATDAASSGYVTAYPTGSAQPATANVNYAPGFTGADLVLVPVNASRQVTLFVGGSGAQLVVDLDGYITG